MVDLYFLLLFSCLLTVVWATKNPFLSFYFFSDWSLNFKNYYITSYITKLHYSRLFDIIIIIYLVLLLLFLSVIHFRSPIIFTFTFQILLDLVLHLVFYIVFVLLYYNFYLFFRWGHYYYYYLCRRFNFTFLCNLDDFYLIAVLIYPFFIIYRKVRITFGTLRRVSFLVKFCIGGLELVCSTGLFQEHYALCVGVLECFNN